MAGNSDKITPIEEGRSIEDLASQLAGLRQTHLSLKHEAEDLSSRLHVSDLERESMKRILEAQAAYTDFLTEFLYSDLDVKAINDVILRHAWKLSDCSYVYLKDEKDQEIGHFGEQEETGSTKIIMPFVYEGKRFGSVVLGYNKGKTQNHDKLGFFHEKVAPVISKKMNQLEEYALVQSQSITDDLTKLKNRRALRQKIKDLKDAEKQYSAALLDIDHFRDFNNTYGHHAGDLVLRHISKRMKAVLGKDSFVARYGGEELVAIVPYNVEETYEMFETLRQDIKANPAQLDGIKSLPIEFTVGIAENDGDFISAETDSDIKLPKSDAAMYFGKGEGRNRIVKYIEDGAGKYYVSIDGESRQYFKRIDWTPKK
jgi:diguanylate cyclase (GGDEF)-like protein